MDPSLFESQLRAAKRSAAIFNAILAPVVGLMLVGLFVDFVPAALLRGSPMMFLMFACGVAGTFALVQRNRKHGNFDQLPRFKRWLGLVLMPFVLMGVFWLIAAKALPWAYTLAVGAPFRESYRMQTHYTRSRYSCDYRLRGGPMEHGFPDSVCISRDYFAAHPDQDVEVEVTGSRSALGTQIEQIRGVY